jgi:hypothetical protein
LGGEGSGTPGGAPAYRDPALSPLFWHVHLILLGTDASLFRPLDTTLSNILHIPPLECTQAS